MKKIFAVATLLTVACSIKLVAQDTSASMNMQNYMTPGDMQKMLAKYDGTWNENVTMWMQPGAAPITSQSSTVNEMILGGRYQQSKITGNMMGTKFEGFSLLGFDNYKKIFTSTWLDNFGTGTLTLQGTWNDTTKTITLTGPEMDPMSGKDMPVKETIQFVDDNTQKFQMFIESPSGEFKVMEIAMTRAKP